MNKKVIIIISIVAILVLCGCCSTTGFFAVFAARNQAEKAISERDDVLERSQQQLIEIEEKSEELVEIGQTCTATKMGVSEAQFVQLLVSYNDPYVKHVRVALNNYIYGSNEGIDELARVGLGTLEGEDGLDNFDSSYYESDFLIYWVENEVAGGGKNITFYFKDQPDMMFTAWVYQLSSGDYVLRGIWDEQFTYDEMQEALKVSGCLLEDDRFAG
jgi:hypothetical protein